MAMSAAACSRAARILVEENFCVTDKDEVIVTADTATDMAVAESIVAAVRAVGARATLLSLEQLPLQGALADPFIPEAVGAAAARCDVWFDLCFPYFAGSNTHHQASKGNRMRYLMLGDLKAESFSRLFGSIALEKLFLVQRAVDEFLSAHEGAPCRITSETGTELRFELAANHTRKLHRTNTPGTYTPVGSAIFFPKPGTVKGRIVLDAVFHEAYVQLGDPICLDIDGEIRAISGGREQMPAMMRSLRRAGGGKFGEIIHFTCGFHRGVRHTGWSFIEDIRSVGANAVGLGKPWWQDGGGENHPDAVLKMQSLEIDGMWLMKGGELLGTPELQELDKHLVLPCDVQDIRPQ
jgi:2,5-dihydroxypyridine 5,6-dioxygenase